MISENAVRKWLENQRQSYADLALEYRERNMNGEQFREFNEMAASGCDSAASALTLLLEHFDQRLAQGMFDAEDAPDVPVRDKQLRDKIESSIRARAADFNGTLHYDAALQLVELNYGYADFTLVLSVLNKLEQEGVVWR